MPLRAVALATADRLALAAQLIEQSHVIAARTRGIPFPGGNVVIVFDVPPGSAADAANQRPSDRWARIGRAS
jgi:hypothetical protein